MALYFLGNEEEAVAANERAWEILNQSCEKDPENASIDTRNGSKSNCGEPRKLLRGLRQCYGCQLLRPEDRISLAPYIWMKKGKRMLLTTNMRVTKYVILSPECTDVLPCDVSTMIYESKHGIEVKETCFGAIIEGEEDAIESLIKEIRALDPAGIFIKDRGFLLGDPRRCRGDASGSPCKLLWITSGRRSGSVRPGSYMIEAESKMLPLISRVLESIAKGEIL